MAKRKLGLLNEVLPSPQRVSASSPRARTMAHMHRLMTVAAAAGALACTKEGSNDTIKADDQKKPKNTADPTSTPTDTVSTTPTTTAVPTNPGYVVVDPMPAPAKCAGAASTISATAMWKTVKAGGMGVEVRLPKSTSPDVIYSHKGSPTASAATIVGATFTGSEVILEVVPDKGATSAYLYVPLECTAGDEHLNVEIDLGALAGGAPPKAGTAVSVTLYDSY